MSLIRSGNVIQQLMGAPTPRQIRQEEKFKSARDAERKLLFAAEFAEHERRKKSEIAKEKALGQYETINGLIGDIESFHDSAPKVLSQEGLEEEIAKRASKYDDPQVKQLFVEGALRGNYEPIYDMKGKAEQKLALRYGMKFDKPDMGWMKTKDGKIAHIPKNSPLGLEPASEKEVEAYKANIPINSPEWFEFLNPTKVEEQVEVVNPDKPYETIFVDKKDQGGFLPKSNKQDRPGSIDAKSLTPAQKSVDQAFGKDYADYKASGGFATVHKNLEQLEDALKTIEGAVDEDGFSTPMEWWDRENLSGTGRGMVPDWMRPITNESATYVEDTIAEVVQQNLKAILGSQFTEKEGEKLIKRAYDPSLDESINAKKVGRLIGQIRAMAKAKESASNYYETHGTLKGWGGKIPTIADIDLSQRIEDALEGIE